MQTNLLKAIQNVALTFHIWLDNLKKIDIFVHCNLLQMCFFFSYGISFRLSEVEAKSKGKIRCNTATVYLFGMFFLKLFSCLTSYLIIVLKLQYSCTLLSYFPFMLSYKGNGNYIFLVLIKGKDL